MLRCNESFGSNYDALSGQLDAITGDLLDADHIEWISPDRKLKICYNVSTLFKCAKKSQFGIQLRHPPHFRGPMTYEMKTEIQERFPEEYNTFVAANQQNEDDGDGDDDDGGEGFNQSIIAHLMQTLQFYNDDDISSRVAGQENLQNYYAHLNMTGELVVCPLCYNYLTTRYQTDDVEGLINSDDDDDDNDDSEDSEDERNPRGNEPFVDQIDSSRDPIRLLTKCAESNVDGVKGCSNFIATTMKKMHVHLKQCHNIQHKKTTRKSGCAGLLNNCKIRAADGLVQRYWRTVQQMEGDQTVKYWGSGCDQKRTVNVSKSLALKTYWGHEGCDRKSMYFDLLFATQRKESLEERGEEVEQRSAWSVLGERTNLYPTTTVRKAFSTLLEPFTTEVYEDDHDAIVNDSDASEDDIGFNHAALDRILDEENEAAHEHLFFARKTPEVGDVVSIRWDLKGGGHSWYLANVLQTTRDGGARPTHWKIQYQEDDSIKTMQFHDDDDNWKVAKLAADDDEEDNESDIEIEMEMDNNNQKNYGGDNEDDEENENEEDDDDEEDDEEDDEHEMLLSQPYSEDGIGSSLGRGGGGVSDLEMIAEDEMIEGNKNSSSFPYRVGDQLKIYYDDGKGRNKFHVQLIKIKREHIKVMYLIGHSTEVIPKEDFELRVVKKTSKAKKANIYTPPNKKTVSLHGDLSSEEDDGGIVVVRSSSKKRTRVFDDEKEDQEDDVLLSSQKKRRVTPSTASKTFLDSEDEDDEIVKSFASKKRAVLSDSDDED